MMKRTLVLLTLAAAMAAAAHAGTVEFNLFGLDPGTPTNGFAAGQAGTAVGWGYTITVSDTVYVTIESITFGDLTPIGIFSTPGIPFSAATLGSPIQVPWQQDISGLQYNIDAIQPVGFSSQGLMTLTYDTFTDAGLTNQVGYADTVNAQFSGSDLMAEVYVNQAAPVGTPEPGAFGLLGLGLLVLARVRAHFGR